MTNNIDLARRSDLSEEIIEKLASDDDYFIRTLIAERKDLSAELT